MGVHFSFFWIFICFLHTLCVSRGGERMDERSYYNQSNLKDDVSNKAMDQFADIVSKTVGNMVDAVDDSPENKSKKKE